MQVKRLGITLIAGFSVLLFVAACGDDKPEPTPVPVLSTPTPEPTIDPTATPAATVTKLDIQKAVERALEDRGTSASVAQLGRIIREDLLSVQFPNGIGIDSDDLDTMIEEELIPAREALLAANRAQEDENETTTPDVLFRYMGAVNSLYAGQNDEAIPAFDLIIRVHPDMARAYYYRGLAF